MSPSTFTYLLVRYLVVIVSVAVRRRSRWSSTRWSRQYHPSSTYCWSASSSGLSSVSWESTCSTENMDVASTSWATSYPYQWLTTNRSARKGQKPSTTRGSFQTSHSTTSSSDTSHSYKLYVLTLWYARTAMSYRRAQNTDCSTCAKKANCGVLSYRT